MNQDISRDLKPDSFLPRLVRPLTAAVTVLPVLGALVFASSCDLFTYKRTFSDAYYDNNYIVAIGFDQFVGDQSASAIWNSDGTAINPDDEGVPIPVTGSWDFPYRYDTKWTNDIPYISLGSTGNTVADYDTSPPAGLDSASPVYRLSLANLIDGGDFESGIGGGWTVGTTVTGGNLPTVDSVTSGGLNGNSVQVSFSSSNQYVLYSIPGVLDSILAASGLTSGDGYLLRFASDNSVMNAAIIDANDTDTIANMAAKLDFTSDPVKEEFTASSTGNDYLCVQLKNTNALVMDDVTLVRNDLSMQCRLRLTRAETDPGLESFLYKFSVWVRIDDTANPTLTPYPLDMLSVDLQPVSGNSSLKEQNGMYVYDASATGWQKITASLSEKLGFEADTLTTDGVLDLIIDFKPFGSFAQPGTILLAQPELRAYPDGY